MELRRRFQGAGECTKHKGTGDLRLRFNKIYLTVNFKQNFDFSKTTPMVKDGHRYRDIFAGTGARVVHNQHLSLKMKSKKYIRRN